MQPHDTILVSVDDRRFAPSALKILRVELDV